MVRNKKNKTLGKTKPKTPPKSKAQGGPLRPTPAPGVVQSGGDTRPARVTAPPPVTASAPTTATPAPGPSSPLGVAPGQTPANYQPIAPPPVGGFTNLGAGVQNLNPISPPGFFDRTAAAGASIAQNAAHTPPLPVQTMNAGTADMAAQNQRTAQGTAQMNNATAIGAQIGTPGYSVTPDQLQAAGRTTDQARAAGLPMDFSGVLSPEEKQKLAQFNRPAPINGRPITPPPPAPHNNAGYTDADFEAMQAQHFGARGSAPQLARQQRGREESAARVAAGRERNAARREQETDARTTLHAAREMGVTVPEYKAIQQAERAEQQTIQRHEQQTRATRHEQRRESMSTRMASLSRQRDALVRSLDNARNNESEATGQTSTSTDGSHINADQRLRARNAVTRSEERLADLEQQIALIGQAESVSDTHIDLLERAIQENPGQQAEVIAKFNAMYGPGLAEFMLGIPAQPVPLPVTP